MRGCIQSASCGLKTLALKGKVRLQKWFTTMPQKAKAKIVKDVTQLVLARRTKMCNVLEYKGAWVSMTPDAGFRPMSFHHADGALSVFVFFRYQGSLQAIRFSFLRVWDLVRRQRTRNAGDCSSLRRSIGSVFRECESPPFPSTTPTMDRPSPSPSLSLVGVRIRLVGLSSQSPTEVCIILDRWYRI